MEQVAIFCDVDDFCKAYEEYCMHSLMMEKKKVLPRTRMALSEIIIILIMYHLSGYRTLPEQDLSNVVEYLLLILLQSKYVTTTESMGIVCSTNIPKWEKVLWTGFMTSSCI